MNLNAQELYEMQLLEEHNTQLKLKNRHIRLVLKLSENFNSNQFFVHYANICSIN